MSNPLALISVVFFLVIYLILFIRFCKSRFGKTVTVSAVVVHKQKVERVSYHGNSANATKYAVTFQIGQKRKSFYVSELSYHGYRKGEKGTLTYRGDRLIDFH